MMDERIYLGQQKIWSEMGRGMYYLAVGSLLVKCLAFHMGLGQCSAEYLVIIGAPVYFQIRSRQLKMSFLPAKGKRNRQVWLIRLGLLTAIAAYWVLNKSQDWKSAAVYLVSFLAAYQVTRTLLALSEKKRAKRLEEEFDSDE
ncbi:MAG: hypothetical protein HFG60_00905 [Lachnospiraceae bacterium]|nr:hypothetical protein [Lachnospiraceae bacterium]